MNKKARPYQANLTKELAESMMDAIKSRCTECPECGGIARHYRAEARRIGGKK